jgi:cytosine/uracil/thiamine/allantoin permease
LASPVPFWEISLPIVSLVGLIVPSVFLYDYSWFVGFAVAFGVYAAMMKNQMIEHL